MAATTHPEFGAATEALEVAKAFASSIQGKTVLITGVNKGGIGYSTSYAIVSDPPFPYQLRLRDGHQASQNPKHLIVAGRNVSKLEVCIDELKADFPDVKYLPLVVDLSSQESIRSAAKEAMTWSWMPTIDRVINSAGVMGVQERTLNADGIEMHFATNHIGHFLLTSLLMPKIIKAAESNPKGTTRIVNVSSLSPTVSKMRWSDVNFDTKNQDLPDAEKPNFDWFKAWGYETPETEAYVPLDGYDRSKVANVLFGIGLNRRLFQKYSIVSTTVHPGVISTELGRHFPAETFEAVKKLMEAGHFTYKTLGAGAATSLVAALDPKLGGECGTTKDGKENWGAYMIDCQISGLASPLAMSSDEAEKLWKLSEELVKEEFAW